MSYFDTPSTYKHEGSIIYPTSHQEYKQKQKSDYGHFDSMEYSSNYTPSKAQYKPNPHFSSWGSAKNNVVQFNPSIVNDGMVMYYSKNNYMNSKDRSIKNNYSLTSMTTDGKYSIVSDSGRKIEVVPDTLNKQPTANRARVSAFPHLDGNYFATAPDFTDTDTKHSQETMKNYFNNHNQFQTQDYITPGTKTVKLESGRVITFEVKPQMKDMARCPRPQENNLEITPNKYAYNVDTLDVGKMPKSVNSENLVKPMELGDENYPLSGLSGVNIPDGMYNKTHYDIMQKLNQEQREYSKEQSILNPKLLVPTNPVETKKENIQTSIANYKADYIRPNELKNERKETFSKIKEPFFNDDDMADELYKQILRTSAKTVCDFLLNFKPYKPWIKHWKILEANLKKTNLNISKLPSTDKEIAYTLDKGEVIKFRWEDSSRYIPKDVYMYVLLHELTHESFPPTFQGHGDPFPQMLCLLCVAATEIGILDIQNIPKNIFMSNGRPITSRESIKTEIMFGIEMLIEANKKDEKIVEYYNAKRQFVDKYS